MDGFGTSTEAMSQASRDVTTAQENVRAELARLRGNLTALQGSWDSTAYLRFVALMSRWDTNAERLSTSLRGIGDAIRSSGLAYQAQEDQESQQISAITAALG
jgi:WXG100 family type VII secretion target